MKIAIIGAGITGLYLAWKLAEKGEDVTVFEKREKIGKQACSGLFSDRILDFIPQAEILVQNEIKKALIRFPRKTFTVNFSRKFLTMEHAALDRLTANLAQKAGAKIALNTNIPRSNLEGGMFDLKRDNFDRIIGCDGALSETRKSLKLKEPKLYLGIQGFIQKDDASDCVETWPMKNGFIWRIPRGKEIEYGIMEKPGQAKTLFNKFLKENNLNLERISAAPIPQGLLLPKNSKITLCGDAAGLTKPWSGGGVVWGLTAADILLKKFPDFIKYQNDAKRTFLPKIIFAKIARNFVLWGGNNMPRFMPKNYKIESDFLT